MPSPSPAISLYSARTITGLGPVAESGQPILIDSIECTVSDEKETVRGACNSIVAIGWGNVSAEWRFSVIELARYGIQDSHPGKLSPTALTNLAKPEFGCLPENGLFLFGGGTRTRRRGGLPVVNFTITCENITRNAGSAEGASTPGIQIGAGGSAGSRPLFTFSSPAAATIGSAFTATLTATGTGTLTWSVAEGYTMPAGLSLNTATGAITGTPTGDAREEIVIFKVSNAYGYDTKPLSFVISAAATASQAVAQVYVRFRIEPASPGNDEFRVIGYSGMSPAPTTYTEFLADTPSGVEKLADTLNIADPDALTGTTSSRDWVIHEIVGKNVAGDYEVWYRLDATVDNYISVLIASGQSPVQAGSGIAPGDVDEPIDFEPPGDTPTTPATPAAFPGYRKPSPRYSHYYLYERARDGALFVGAVGGTYGYADIGDFETKHPTISTSYEDGAAYWLVELYEVGVGYLYQRAVGDTKISTAVGLTRSPYYHLPVAVTQARKASSEARRTASAFTPLSLPLDPGGISGPAPATAAKVYARTRNPFTDEHKTYGYSTGRSATWDTLNEWTNARGTWTIGGVTGGIYYFDYDWFDDSQMGGFANDQNGYEIIMELWVHNGSVWQCLYLYSGEGQLVGECLAANVSPVNNAHTAPGRYYA